MTENKDKICLYCSQVVSFPFCQIALSLSIQLNLHYYLKRFDSVLQRILISTLFGCLINTMDDLIFKGILTIYWKTIIIQVLIASVLQIESFTKWLQNTPIITDIFTIISSLAIATSLVSKYILRIRDGQCTIICFLNALFASYGTGAYLTILKLIFGIPLPKKGGRIIPSDFINGLLFLIIFHNVYSWTSSFFVEILTILFAIEKAANSIILRHYGFSIIDSIL
ncbi:hypothetical protein ENUP19_0297G0042 [Entamoeba nuttalli]|uniref:Transmembrane protein n=2 Tax=Entamoeba nuttalli TaxID=412467 RepID=K2H2E3_ENTNP|nr:hypothetical protein ENU1_089080 [Entamoeba nuttalli P19]EKE40482.1 hypothetical protein ENU1_089080 [Entamoeba nuttalli P19]|eukprot:XP_008857180.1 hypothetical protein ENU1_089080 [Entamoeba nuttalli P19]